jgi:hypothetical protein
LGEVGYNSAMAIAPANLPVFYNKVKLMPFMHRRRLSESGCKCWESRAARYK